MHSIILLVLVSLALSADFIHFEGNLNATSGFITWEYQANVKINAILVVDTPAPLILCLQELYPIPLNFSTWNQHCSISLQINPGNLSTTLPVRNVPYMVALSSSNVNNPVVNNVVFTLGETDDSCPSGQVYDYDTSDCIQPQQLQNGKTNISMVNGDPQFFVVSGIPTGSVVGSIKISSDSAFDAAAVTFWIRRSGSPSQGNFDQTGATVEIDYPRDGTYYVAVIAAADEEISIDTVIEICGDGKAGPGCADTYTWGTSNVSLVVGLKPSYFKVNASVSVPLWVNVRSQNGTNNPTVYASFNQLPQPGNADINGCNQQYCDIVSVINLNVTSNQTWFISVVGTNGTSYGLWFDSVCGPDCADHGDCTMDGPTAGLCDCVADFIGVTCQITNGLGAQYIVLIIIASLVVASAVIGFVAWAYMRRKRVQYEHVG